MDYIGYDCPVCGKPFHANEDIVVCPECGTPHHRDCYDQEGHCHFEDKHGENFEFQNTESTGASAAGGEQRCRQCGAENKTDALFCLSCGNPLQDYRGTEGPQPGRPPFNPFNGPAGQQIQFDLGLDLNEELESGVTGGDVAKYVQRSVPYYMRVFGSIKRFSKSRFNFCAFLFHGGYLLYRKQYKIGAIITAIMAVIIIASTVVTYSDEYRAAANILYSNSNYITASYMDFSRIYYAAEYLTQEQLIAFFIPPILELIQIGIMIYVGATANRKYYKHCTKEIKKIKNSTANQSEIRERFEKSGGVNSTLGISLFVAYAVITYLPLMFF